MDPAVASREVHVGRNPAWRHGELLVEFGAEVANQRFAGDKTASALDFASLNFGWES
jgi:hypothetical protein